MKGPTPPTSQGSRPSRWHPILLLAAGFGVGYVPGLPGTLGTALGLVVSFGLLSAGVGWVAYALVTLALLAIGVPICGWAARRLGRADPSLVVWDELASVPIVFLLVPWQPNRAWWVLLVGFAAHRFFDILKPWPIRCLERLPGGWGIVADDVVAAAFAQVVLRLAIAVISGLDKL
jgi:phosphatidylglycerophosphatase A